MEKEFAGMKSSYNEDDVILLLNDMTGKVSPVSQEERKERVAKGEHVRSIIIEEYGMSTQYEEIIKTNIEKYLDRMAMAVGKLSELLYQTKGKNMVLVDIARAGIPIGILVKRYLKQVHDADITHYGISLVDGLDPKAMEYILSRHRAKHIQFIDGWTGKGTVANEIKKCVEENYPWIDSGLAVLSDCTGVAKYAGTREDIYIPHSPLNASATGLVSITVKNEEFENPTGFHSAIYLDSLEQSDISREFIEMVTERFTRGVIEESSYYNRTMYQLAHGSAYETKRIAEATGRDAKALNPGINEAARAVLRRKLEKLLVSKHHRGDDNLEVLIKLAELKGVPVEEMDMHGYKAVSVASDNYVR